jgi:hypothetical protein
MTVSVAHKQPNTTGATPENTNGNHQNQNMTNANTAKNQTVHKAYAKATI